jgi:D-alanyl-D-alanine carboxypeptidase
LLIAYSDAANKLLKYAFEKPDVVDIAEHGTSYIEEVVKQAEKKTTEISVQTSDDVKQQVNERNVKIHKLPSGTVVTEDGFTIKHIRNDTMWVIIDGDILDRYTKKGKNFWIDETFNN